MPDSPPAADQTKPARFELRMSLVYAAIFVAQGLQLPYFPPWLSANGFNAAEIAIILSAPMFLRVVSTPLVTALADRTPDRAFVLILLAAGSLLASLGYLLTPTYALMLAISLVFAFFLAPQTPLCDAIALSGVRRFGSNYPAMRIWGSIAFLLANLGGGLLLGVTGIGAVPLMMSGSLAVALAASVVVPRLGRPRRASPLSAVGFRQAGPRLFERRFILLVLGAGLISGSHGFLYGFVSIYWERIGLEPGIVGVLWSWSVVAEVFMFVIFTRLFGGRSAYAVLLIAAAAAMLRWAVMPCIWPLGLGVPGFFLAQTLHAFSTALILIGVQLLIARRVPEENTGAAQGVAFFANGTAMALVTLASGPLFASYGEFGFLAMVPVAGLGIVAILAAGRAPAPP
ncbi:MAG: MFS transporter [Rhizobiaceae bacterium]|nr:MFS transporter [Rhizobiaceae bacterium]